MDLDGDVLCFHVMPLFQEVFVALMNAIALRVGYPIVSALFLFLGIKIY